MKVNNQFKGSLKSATRWLPAALLVAGLALLCLPQLSNWYRASATNRTSTNSHAIEVSPSSRSQAVRPRNEATPIGKLPIESLRVGDRVLATNPEVTPKERAAFVEPNWHEWLQLSLSMPKGDGSLLTIELLRPESWVRSQMGVIAKQHEAVAVTELASSEAQSAGQSVSVVPLSPIRPIYRDLAKIDAELELSGEQLQALFVDMDLPELAITGAAVVHDIRNAPLIAPGAGRVVTATFKHSSGDVIDLVISDGVSSTTPKSESIGTTSNHPFWSVDREEYVQAGQLELGERVQTYSGDTKRVLAKLPRPGPQAVYNLEVFAEHVYYVGEDGVLVHNSYGAGRARVKHSPLEEGDVDQYAFFNVKSRRGDPLDGHELWQNANTAENFLSGGGRSGSLAKRNPAIALSESNHATVNKIQDKLIPDAAKQKPLENIIANIKVLRAAQAAGVPITDKQIKELAKRAVRFYQRHLDAGNLKK